jgi:hypothetical protein
MVQRKQGHAPHRKTANGRCARVYGRPSNGGKRTNQGEDLSRTLANASASDRPATDFYSTPPDCTQSLLNYLKLPSNRTVWECASGSGSMADIIESNGYKVIRSDVDFDFLNGEVSLFNWDWIVTNPPFYLAEDFIGRAASLNTPFAFLLKSQYWHSKRRLKLFRDYRPKYVLALSWRPDFLFGAKGGALTMDCIWCVWEPPHESATIFDVLERPK